MRMRFTCSIRTKVNNRNTHEKRKKKGLFPQPFVLAIVDNSQKVRNKKPLHTYNKTNRIFAQ